MKKSLILVAVISSLILRSPGFAQEVDGADESSGAAKQEQPGDEGQAPVEHQAPVERRPFYRAIPGKEPREVPFPSDIYESTPRIENSASEFVPVPDRWRQLYNGNIINPYEQNVLKADIPAFGKPGHEWFFELTLLSDTLSEERRVPTPVGGQSTKKPGELNTLGRYNQYMLVENILTSFSLIRGNTSFKPPDFEFRVTPVFNLNYANIDETVLRADPGFGSTRGDNHLGLQEAFADIHLANVSQRYDFVSSRIGIQPFISDFRGFVYDTSEPGVRLFGNLDNNYYQYNLAWFSRLDKDTNSGVNSFHSRHEDVFIGNMYFQDLLAHGHTVQGTVIYRGDIAGSYGSDYNSNGILERPAAFGDESPGNIYSTYIGLNGDGHIERVNTTTSFYYVTGSQSHNQLAQRQVDISAEMFAQEFSYDVDWMRFRASFFWASGDRHPFDSRATGFDAIFDNPDFAGGDNTYWQRQGIPLIGGGGVNLTNRNSLLADFRASKEEGQSNFVNPGLRLYNLGADFEITPKLKLITNASFLQFDQIGALKAVRQDGSFSHDIGVDVSAGFLYRPFLTNNFQVRFGGAVLTPAGGLKNLYGDTELFDIFTNLILLY